MDGKHPESGVPPGQLGIGRCAGKWQSPFCHIPADYSRRDGKRALGIRLLHLFSAPFQGQDEGDLFGVRLMLRLSVFF